MPDNLKELFNHSLPFMVAAGQGPEKVNLTRMLEAVIIAAIVGAGAWFMLIPELKAQFKYQAETLSEVKADIKHIDSGLDKMETRVDELSVEVAKSNAFSHRHERTDL